MFHDIITIISWIGSIAFSLCAVPQAYEAFKNKYCNLNKYFLSLWLLGESCTLIYATSIQAWPLIVNYILNGLCLLVILYYNRSDNEI